MCLNCYNFNNNLDDSLSLVEMFADFDCFEGFTKDDNNECIPCSTNCSVCKKK